jgi:hypothetical protein
MPELNEEKRAEILEGIKSMVPTSSKFIDGPGYYSFYTNNVAFSVNQLDIALILGEIVDVSPAQEVTIERRARVTMNPAQAKALSKILSFAVDAYETQNGPVMDLPIMLPGAPSKKK